jgi:hypothetical protein
MRIGFVKHCGWVGCLTAAMALAPNLHGASFTADLTCVLNGLNNHPCVAGPSFGTVKLEDQAADLDHDFAWVKMTVDLKEDFIKFFDLALNYTGSESLTTMVGGPISVDPDNLVINPYDGAFDVGFWGIQGSPVPNPWMTDIYSTTGNVFVSEFIALDTGGKVMTALHIQSIGVDECDGNNDGTTDCVPGMDGTGSLKIGGTFRDDSDTPDVPEPSTMLLLGGSLLALGYFRKKRNS